jgi:hypothetical protein
MSQGRGWGGSGGEYGRIKRGLRDSGMSKDDYKAEAGRIKELGYKGYMEEQQGKANDLLQEAQDLAASGDMAGAEALKAEANAMVSGMMSGKNAAIGMGLDEGDPTAKMNEVLSGPMAQTAGKLVREGQEMLDRDSDTSKAYRRSLTEGGERSIAMGDRARQRGARDASLAAGGARNFAQEQGAREEASRGSAYAMAQLHTNAAAQYESHRTQFAADTVKFGMDFINNVGPARKDFADSIARIKGEQASAFGQQTGQLIQLKAMDDAQAAQKRAQTMSMVKGVAMLALGAATGGVGAVAAAGSFSMGAAVTGAASGMGSMIGAQPKAGF